MKRIISIWILLLCAGISKVQAQNDATLAGMILVYTNKAEKELKNQEKVMLMQTTGHVWTKEEVEGTTDLQPTHWPLPSPRGATRFIGR